jgi:type IV pilus assembly protein PilW
MTIRTRLPNQTRYSTLQPKGYQNGLTLLELLISMSLGLLLLVGIGTIYVGSNQTYRVQQDNARLQETGRYALEVIGRSLRQAGYRDVSASSVNPDIPTTWTAITATNGSGTDPDTITLQYQWTTGDRACDGDVTGLAGALVRDSFNLDITPHPTTGLPKNELKCQGDINATPPLLGLPPYGQPLLDLIEDLQFLYGVDTDADQSANFYTDAGNVPNWGQVVNVKVCVLVHSTNLGITTAAQRYLTCNGALGEDTTAANDVATATDTSLRRTFVATFNLRNRVLNTP